MKINNKKIQDDKGAMMVEASIYFPIVIGIVMAVIYVSLWKIEDCAAFFAAQKVADSASKAMAHQNYELLYGDIGSDKLSIDTQIDFSWDEDIVPKEYVEKYYSADKNLYMRVNIEDADYEKSLKNLLEKTKFVPFKIGNDDIDVDIDAGLLRSVVTVDVTVGFDTPGIMKYIGFSDEFKFHSKAYQFVTEPVDFVRNSDLAFDLIDYLFDRLGITSKIEAFTSKFDKIKQKLGL